MSHLVTRCYPAHNMKKPRKQGGEVIEEEHPQQRYKLLCNRCCKRSNHYSNKTFISSIIRLDAIVTAKGM